MIGFYLTTNGSYNPEQIEDVSNSFVMDDLHKSLKVMGEYVFEFQKLSAAYKGDLPSGLDPSNFALSLKAARDLYGEIQQAGVSEEHVIELINTALADSSLNTKVSALQIIQTLDSSVDALETAIGLINSSVNTLETNIGYVNTSIGTINSSVNGLETWQTVVNTSVADINSSISTIKTDYIPNASMGVNSGVATLDAEGHVPSSQLPSYVDDVIEGYLYEGVFYEDAQHETPITGQGGKIYVDLTTNTSWRWGGSAYTQVSESLALGETQGTAYEGSKGKALKDDFDAHDTSAAIHVSAADRTAWDDAADKKHSHTNKDILDGIVDSSFHAHDNKSVLDGITSTDVTNWNNASDNSHSHSNIDVLDGITDSSFHTHDNKSTLDSITSTDVANWNDASDNSHTHDNKAILDGFVDASVTAWNDAESKAHEHTNSSILNGITDASIAEWMGGNVQADWNATSGDASILNRPNIADAISASTGALVTDGAIKEYVDSTISKAHEHSNKNLLDSIVDASFHTHSNKDILDGLNDTSIANWNDAESKAHEHSNKSVIDGITSDDVTNWIDASNAKHTHSNSGILNGLTDTSISDWNSASADAHSHTNKTLLDGIADSSFHTHTNKDILDGLTDTSISNWNTAYTNNHTHSNADILNGFTDTSIADFIRDTSYGQGSVQDLTTGTDTTPKVWDASVINAYVAQLDANAVRYKGDINAGTGAIVDTQDTLTTIANKKGDVYVVSTAGTLCGVELQVGDSIIFKKNVAKNTAPVATDITFVQGTVKVTNEDATLQWGVLTKVANVEGVDISVGLPSLTANDISTALNYIPGTVSSVAMTVPTGLSISGSPITESGTLAVSLDTGYAIPKDASLDNFQTAYGWGDHSQAGYAQATVVADISAYAVDLSTRANGRIDEVSAYAIDVSTRLSATNTALETLTTRVADVSTYAINVSTYAANVSTNTNTRIANVSTLLNTANASIGTLTTRVANVSTYEIEVSTRLNATNSSVNTKFTAVDSSLQEIFNHWYEFSSSQAAAWRNLYTRNPSLNE